MSDQPESGVAPVQAMLTRVHDVAQLLRDSPSVSREVQSALAELLDELSAALKAPNTPPAEVAQLAESAAHLTEILHDQPDEGVLEKARDRLGSALIRAEDHAPIAVGLARRVIDALANIGI